MKTDDLDAIRSYVRDNWTFTRVIELDGIPHKPVTGEPWAIASISGSDARPDSLGPKIRTFETGVLTIQIFAHKTDETGSKISDRVVWDIASQAKQFFLNKRAGRICFNAPSTRGAGYRDGYFQVNLICPYEFTDFET